MIVFEWLKNWFDENEQKLARNKITFSFSNLVVDVDKPSQFVDIDTKTQMARITLWETGECDFEILNNKTRNLTTWENRIIKSNKELVDFLNQVFSKL